MPVAETALAYVAAKLLDQLSGDLSGASSRRVQSWLRRDPQQFACQVALARTEARFAELHPDWHGDLFDEHFLKTAAAPLLARSLSRGHEAGAAEVADAWAGQLGRAGTTERRLPEATLVAADLLRIWREEIGRHDVFQSVLDSVALDRLADAAVGLDDVRTALATLDRTLLRARYPALEDYVDWASRRAVRTHDLFVGREWAFARLEELADASRAAYLSVEAEAGLGKTALAIAFAARKGAPLFLFSEAAGSVRADQCLNHLCVELIDRYGLAHDRLPDRAGEDSGLLLRLLEEAAEPGPVWVIVDALDEAAGLPLPDELPTGAYVLLAHRPGDHAPAVRPGTDHHRLTIRPNNARQQDDVIAYLRERAGRDGAVGGALSKTGAIERLAAASEGNFMYLAYVLEGLREAQAINLDELPSGLRGYYDRMWHSIVAEADRDWEGWTALHLPVIELLAVAGEPVTPAWLATLTGRSAAEIRRRALHTWRRFLGSSDGAWRVVHQSFRDFLAAKEDVDLVKAHRTVAEHFLAGSSHRDGYASRHLCAHLRLCGEHDALFALVERDDWRAAQLAADPSGSLYRSNMEEAWDVAWAADRDALLAGRNPPYLLTEVLCALSIAEQRSYMEKCPVELMLRLLEVGMWTHEQVLTAATSRPQPIDRVETLIALVPHLDRSLRDRALAEAAGSAAAISETYDRAWAFAALRKIASGAWERRFADEQRRAGADGLQEAQSLDDYYFSRIIERLASSLEPDQVAAAAEVARDLRDPQLRRSALLALVPHLSASEHEGVFEMCLASLRTPSDEYFESYDDLAEQLPEPFLERLLDTIAARDDPDGLARLLRSLAPRLSPAYAGVALQYVKRIEDPDERAVTRATLAARLGEPELEQVFLRALESVERDPDVAVSRLEALAPDIPEALLPRALDVVRHLCPTDRDPDEDEEAVSIAYLLSPLVARVSEATVHEFVGFAMALAEPSGRAAALTALAPYLSDASAREAFDAVAVVDREYAGPPLTALAAKLPDDLIPAAFEHAANPWPVLTENPLPGVLAALAPRLPDELLPAALNALGQKDLDDDARSTALAALAPRLRPDLLPSAIGLLSADTYWRASALGALAGELQGDDRLRAARQAVAAADEARDPSTTAYTVASCASYLTDEERAAALDRAWSSLPTLEDEFIQGPLIGLIRHLDGDRRRAALTRLDARRLFPSEATALLPHLTDEEVEQLVPAVAADLELDTQAEVLALLIPRLPPPVAVLHSSAPRFSGSIERLAQVLPHLRPEDRDAVVEGYVGEAEGFDDAGSKASALAKLGQLLPEGRQAEVLEDAARATAQITDELLLVLTVAHVAPLLPASRRRELVAAAVDASDRSFTEKLKIAAIATLAPALGADREARITEAFEQAVQLNGMDALEAIRELAPHLPDALIHTALERAADWDHPLARASLVGSLAARLPEETLEQSLLGLPETADSFGYSTLLEQVAPHLTGRTLPAALAATAKLRAPSARAQALALLVGAHAIDRTDLHAHVHAILRLGAAAGSSALDQALWSLRPVIGCVADVRTHSN